jgi:N-acetylmuramoyl-L-alanine amidase/S-layer homology domain
MTETWRILPVKARIIIALVRLACMVMLIGLILSPLGPPRPVAAPLHLPPQVGEASTQASFQVAPQAAPQAQAGIAGSQVVVSATQMLRDKGDGTTAPVTQVALSGQETSTTFLTPPSSAPRPFSDVVPHFSGSVPPGAKVDIDLHFSNDGQTFGDWQPASFEDVADPERDKAGEFYGSLVSVPPLGGASGVPQPGQAQYAQARLRLSATAPGKGPSVTQFTFAFIDVPPSASQPNLSSDPNVAGRPPLVKRSDWGAPASSANWPPVYAPVSHIIVHHSGTGASSDWAAQVRALWYYHTYVRGWGDIGYNYLIDPLGTIYEGRAGGPDVAGSHTYPFNYGSVGIVLLGNYQYSDLPAPMLDSLSKLLAWQVKQLGIDPQGSANFSGKLVCGDLVNVSRPNIAPASDFTGSGCGQTFNNSVSPGDKAVAALPALRKNIAAALPIFGATFLSHDTPPQMKTGATYNVNLTVRNSGSLTWHAAPIPPTPTLPQNGGGGNGGSQNGGGGNGSGQIRLGYRWFDANGNLLPIQDQRTSLQRDIPFGATVNLYATVTAPSVAGSYTLTLDMIDEGVTWFYEQGSAPLRVPVTVGAGDSIPPVSRINALPLYQISTDFVVSWSGADEGSGILNYDVEYKLPPYGNWQPLVSASTAPNSAFRGVNGYTYYFRVRARDKAGNVEQFRDAPNAQTTVDTVPPPVTISTPRQREIVPTGVITITGTTERGALVLVNDVQANVVGENYTATIPTRLAGRNYVITARAWDYAGNTASTVTIAYLQSNFSDLPASGATRDALIFVADRGIISGYSDDSFRPDQPMTRADAAQAGVVAAGWPTDTAKPRSFSDVPADYVGYNFIQSAVGHGAIDADPAGSNTFQPKAAISRYDIVRLAVVAQGWSLENPSTAHFGDVSNSSPYYKYVETAYTHGILPDSYKGPNFSGDTAVTRGDAALILYHALK